MAEAVEQQQQRSAAGHQSAQPKAAQAAAKKQDNRESSEEIAQLRERLATSAVVQAFAWRSRQISQSPLMSGQRRTAAPNNPVPLQRRSHKTGLPDNLKTGMEHLSGMNLDHVRVHYNSSKPATVQAHAFAQGSDIHIAGGQEKHLPHELGHVVQQAQGRVKPTTSVGGVSVNDDTRLEDEATCMGEAALQGRFTAAAKTAQFSQSANAIQRALAEDDDITTTQSGRYRWKEHRTDVEKSNEDQWALTAGGRGAAIDNAGLDVEDKETTVKWASVDPQGKEGKKMEAVLGPDHKLGSPPAPGGIWARRRRDLSRLARPKGYIAGHLLNNNLGGPGNIAENLTAIPEHVNAKHSAHVETPIIKAVNEQGAWLKYIVEVGYASINGVLASDLGYENSAEAQAKNAGYEVQDTTYVKVYYADELKCSWGPTDFAADTEAAEAAKGELTIDIEKPQDEARTMEVNPPGDIDIKGLATTEIGATNLVLSNTKTLRSAHIHRQPLVELLAYKDDLIGHNQAQANVEMQLYIEELIEEISQLREALDNAERTISEDKAKKRKTGGVPDKKREEDEADDL